MDIQEKMMSRESEVHLGAPTRQSSDRYFGVNSTWDGS